jgi:NtrC-family two-component system sensor histidine kinase KinB
VQRLSAGTRMTFSQVLKLVLFVGASGLAVAVFLFTQQMVTRLSREVEATSGVLARFCAQASFPATRDPELRRIFSDVIAHVDFPIVITDVDGTPRAWRHIDVDPALVSAASIDSLQEGRTIAPVIQARIERVREQAKALDAQREPIPMTIQGTQIPLGEVHYGDPEVLARLRWMPIASVAGVVLLLGIGLGGLAILRRGEQSTIWVGMAKETAHQLGTPLSSLMGWTALLRDRGAATPDGDVRVPGEAFHEAIDEIERDVERLNRVAQRFSHVGSAPQLKEQDVTHVVRDVVAYMRPRVPHGEVELRERYEPVPPTRLNPELIAWALENLIANAASAIDKRPGLIEVSVAPGAGGRGIEIEVRDNGRGMTPREQRRVFEPGYTTKRRGWGLGLALARRVVEEYHGGRISVRQSAPGKGTTMGIRLPA